MVGFPRSTNGDYRGSPLSVALLMLVAVLEFAAGCVHYFLPDGGAGVIAGIDLSQGGRTIIAVFAWFGAAQIPMAILLFVIAVRYRSLTPLALLTVILSRGLMAIDGWFLKGAAGGHHPPEHFASPIAVVLALVFFGLAVRERPASQV